MNAIVYCRKSKKDTLYLCQKGQDGKLIFINLVKNNHRWVPNGLETGKYQIVFGSYLEEEENRQKTFFDVTEVVYQPSDFEKTVGE
jgi:hypothetical protein